MTTMKRILAMLLAIMMLMGGALAEGDILMIAQDIAEETVYEESAGLPGEEPETEDEEVLFEDVFAMEIIEEEVSEEETEPEYETEAEGGMQLIALQLSDGEETEDEVCLHEDADSWEEKINFVYDMDAATATTHSYTCDIVMAYYCGDCDSEWESDVVQSGVQATEEHAWSIDWNDENAQEGPGAQYHCMDCGYVSACEHAFELVDKDLFVEACADNGDGTHSYTEYFDCRYCCEKCGVEYWQKDEAGKKNRTEPHDIHVWIWEDAEGKLEKEVRCEYCDADIQDTCEHDFVVVESDYNSESCTDNGDGTHTGVTYTTYSYECSKCGAGKSSEVRHDEKTVTNEPHVWKGECFGAEDILLYCAVCAVKPACEHDFQQGEVVRADVHRLHDNGDGTHNLQLWCRVEYTCSKCGVSYWSPEEDNLITVENEAHEMDANGRCIWCFSSHVCDHDHPFGVSCNPCKKCGFSTHTQENFTQITQYGLLRYEPCTEEDKTGMHRVVKAKETVTCCVLCGQIVSEEWFEDDALVEEEKHFFLSDTCYYCGAPEPACPQSPSGRHEEGEYTKCKYCNYCVWHFDDKDDDPGMYSDGGYCENCFYYNEKYDTKQPAEHKHAPRDNAYRYESADGNSGWEYLNATHHIFNGMGSKIAECKICHETYAVSISDEEFSKVSQHNDADQDSFCDACGCYYACAHKNTREETYVENDMYYGLGESIDAYTHSAMGKKYTDVYCADCGELLETRGKDQPAQYYESPHTVVNTTDSKTGKAISVCMYCDYRKNQCKTHKWKEIKLSREGLYYAYDHYNHLFYGEELLHRECTVCLKYEVKETDVHGEKRAHNYKNGVCMDCGEKMVEVKSFTVNGVTDGRITIGYKLSHALDIDIQPADANVKPSFKSSNKKVATVSKDGVIKGVAAGTAKITVSVDNPENPLPPFSFSVKVDKAPTKVSLPKAPSGGERLNVGEEMQLSATVKPAGIVSQLSWSSDKPEVATVENGVVKGLTPGTAKITVKTQNGKKATYTVKVVPVPTGIQVEEALLLGEGQSYTLNPVLEPEGAEGRITYAVEGDAVSLNGNKIKAEKEGNAQVTVSSYGLPDQIVNVTVVKAPDMVFFARQTVAASLKEKTMQLKPIIDDDAAAGYTWSSGNKKVATVDANGLVTFKKAGSVTITVKTHNKKIAKCKINIVPKAPTSFEAVPGNADLLVGESTDVQLKFKKNEGSSEPVMRVVSGEGVVSYQDGMITALKTGSATLEFEAYNGVKAQCTVNVYPELQNIEIISKYAEVSVKQKVQLDVKRTDAEGNEIKAGAYQWSTSNDKIAVVDANGLMTVKAPGVVEITVTAYNGVSSTALFGAVPAPTKVELSQKKVTMGVKDGFILEARADMPATFTVKSSNSKVAKVELMREKGDSVRYSVYAAGKTGTATITFKTHNGKTAKCTVTVKAEPKTVKLNYNALELALGETAALKTTVTPKKAADVFTWKTSNDQVVTVENGVLTTVGVGVAVITAEAYNGLKAECTVKVWPEVAKVEIYGAKYMSMGQKQTLTVKTYDAEGKETIGAFTIKPSAKLSVKGMVAQAKKVGANQSLTVTTYNGLTAVLDVTIVKVPGKVTAAEKAVTLTVGETYKPVLSAPVKDAPADYVYSGYGYTTSNKKVAVVVWDEKTGAYVISAVGKGTAAITARTHNGKKANIKVTVVEAPLVY